MNFKIDPSFEGSGARARKRQRLRLGKRLGMGAAGLVVLGALIWAVSGVFSPGPTDGFVTLESSGGADDFAMVQTDQSAETPVRVDPMSTFVHLRRDPMILRFETTTDDTIKRLPGPTQFAPDRAGRVGPDRLSVLRDDLFVAERRLVTTLPSSRDDLALFQAQRSRGLNGADPAPSVRAPVAAGEVVRVAEEGSWGDLIASDNADNAATEDAAVYVETRIENTTSAAVTLRDARRQVVYEDDIIVLSAPRALQDVLASNGLTETEAANTARAAARILNVEDDLPAGSIVALRMRGAQEPPRLIQMSLYGPDGYIAALSQIGAGRFVPAADPWLETDLMSRSDKVRQQGAPAGNVRLLDALYSAGIRNGLSTKLVGEMIVIMSKRFDLDRFVSDGDRLTILYATNPGPAGQGLGQLFFIGIDGPSGKMPCYVTQGDTTSGYACFNFDAPGSSAPGQTLGAALRVPVEGVKTSGFGPRRHPILKQVRNHNGVDWAAPTGTPVHAAAAGRIKVAGNGGGYGNVVYIDHGNGMETRYAHLNNFSPKARQGAQVAAGDVIGFVGTTGRSTGPHLHFELRVNGRPVNPLTFSGSGGGRVTGSGAVEALVNQIIKVESAGNANAKNPLSTATGLGQFIQSTWLRMMRDYRPELYKSMSRPQLLALRTDPELSREMVTNLARENESFLRARGHQITPGRLYLAHFLGPAGADKALRANAEATVLAEMGAAVVNANPFLRGRSIAWLRSWADRKMGGAGRGAVIASAPAPRVTPPEVKEFQKAVDSVLAAL